MCHIIILECKTAKHTGIQDSLMLIYEVQLNGHRDDGFALGFKAIIRKIRRETTMIPLLLMRISLTLFINVTF
jgi:hypothetical protein